MALSAITFVVLLAVWSASALPNKLTQTFSHEGVGYAVLNHTVQPAPDGCTITSVYDVASAISSCTTINVGSFSVPASYQPLIMNLQQGTTLTFTGQILFEKNAFNGYLLEIIGVGIKVVGSSSKFLFDLFIYFI